MRAIFPMFSACLFMAAASTHAQNLPKVDNIVESDGTVKALHESQVVVTTRFWTFLNSWSYIKDWQTTGDGTATFARRGSLNPGYMNVSTQVANGPSYTDLTFGAVPSRDVFVDSAHLNLMFDEAFWAGATLSDGFRTVTFSPNFTQSFDTSGFSQLITVTRPDGFRLTISTPTGVRWSCRDSRNYHVGFELRLDERWGSWSTGTGNTYRARLEYTSATITVPDQAVTIRDTAEWHPLAQSMSVVSGSALDWSTTRPAAGSQGWLTVNPYGQFAFPGSLNRPERFYGVNLSHYACFPTRGEAAVLAENLARMGYNTVRLHHFDYVLVRSSADSTTIDPQMMDRLNYLVFELKKRGFYISVDLHSMRTQKPNEIIPGEIDEHNYKALLLVSQQARQNYLRFASNLLNTRNSYTGYAWKEEPTIAWMSIGNENAPYWFDNPRADIKSMLNDAVGGVWNPWSESGSQAAMQLCNATAAQLKSQLRAMGVKSLFTNINAGFNRALAIGRQDVDFVDNHLYFAHPEGFALPLRQKNTTPLRKIEEVGWFASSRIAGKPFTVSEFDAVAPNQFRAEFGLIVGALGVVQKWDGMWRFQYADNVERALNPRPMSLFSIASDPLSMATERAIVALYLRNDLTSSDEPYYVANPLANADQDEIREEPVVKQSVLAKGIAQVDSTENSGNGIVYDGHSLNAEQTVHADLNALSMKVRTALTSAAIGSEGTSHAVGPLQVTFTKTRATVYLTSVDKSPLATSKRMLLAHLTDVQNTGATFSGTERKILTNWGTLPHLVRDGVAAITLQVANPKSYKVYRLDLSGRRISTVSFTRTSTSLSFNATTSNPQDGSGVIYYEIAGR